MRKTARLLAAASLSVLMALPAFAQQERVIRFGHLNNADHPVSRGLSDFTLVDERYSHLETGADITVLHDHHFEDTRHPLVWARDAGPGRVVYDALGHDTVSYDAPGHREMLDRAIRWLLHEL